MLLYVNWNETTNYDETVNYRSWRLNCYALLNVGLVRRWGSDLCNVE